MTVGQYLTTSGTAGPSEQDTLYRLDEFMVGALGWNRIDVITDSATDNDRVWYSEGEVPGTYNPMYVRARANGDDIIFYGYTYYDPSTDTGSDEIADATELQIPNNNSGGLDEYVFVGNKDAVFVSIRINSNGANYVGGFGYWDTYYSATQDPYPLWVMGQNARSDTFNNTLRVFTYGYDPDGFLHTGSTISGGVVGFVGQDLSAYTALATPNPRDGRHLMMKAHFYRERSSTTGDIPGTISHEIRGEIPGLYQFYGSNFAAHDRVVASGVSIGEAIPGDETGTGDFLVCRSTQANTFTLGPLEEYAPVPPTISDLEVWLHGAAVQRRDGGDQVGGRVAAWIDLSEKSREASQSTEADQPNPLASGSGVWGQPVVGFDNSDYLTGTVEVTNDYTAFVVASYDESAERQPLFYTRGDIGGDDYIFGLEFNGLVDNSANLTVRTDSSPLEEDVIVCSGLSSDTYYIVSAIVSDTDASLYVNGDSASSVVVSGTKTTIAGSTELSFGIGSALDSGGSAAGQARHEGNIAEVVVYTKALTTFEHQSILCHFENKYGITVSGVC